MNKFVPFFQILLADWIADLLGWCGTSLAAVGITLSVPKDAPTHIAIIATGVVIMGCQRVISYINLKVAHGSPVTPPNVISPIRAAALIGLISISCFSLMGCAGMPSQFANENPPLSDSSVKIVEGLASFDSPEALLGIRTGTGTVVSIGMYGEIKQTSTMQRDGLALNGMGKELVAFTGGSIGDVSDIHDILTGVKANATTTQSVDNFDTIGQGINGVLASAKTYITNAAASTTDPKIAAYAVTVFSDDVHAAGLGVCDVTNQYVPTTPVLTLRLGPTHEQTLVALEL